MIDKNKIKEKIQKSPSKDIQYLSVNPVESKSLQNVFKQIENFVGRNEVEIIVIRK